MTSTPRCGPTSGCVTAKAAPSTTPGAGGQIEVTITAEDKVVTGGEGAPKPLLSRHDDETDIAGWLAEDERAGNEKRLKAIERQAAKAVP